MVTTLRKKFPLTLGLQKAPWAGKLAIHKKVPNASLEKYKSVVHRNRVGFSKKHNLPFIIDSKLDLSKYKIIKSLGSGAAGTALLVEKQMPDGSFKKIVLKVLLIDESVRDSLPKRERDFLTANPKKTENRIPISDTKSLKANKVALPGVMGYSDDLSKLKCIEGGSAESMEAAKSLKKLNDQFNIEQNSFFLYEVDFFSGKSLADLAVNNEKDIKFKKPIQLLELFDMILAQIEILQEKNILHRDIKPVNILLKAIYNDDGTIKKLNEAKLIDFGLATKMADKKTKFTDSVAAGSINYMDRSVFHSNGDFNKSKVRRGANYTKSSDIASTGINMLSLLGIFRKFHLSDPSFAKLFKYLEDKADIDIDFVKRSTVNEALQYLGSKANIDIKQVREIMDSSLSECLKHNDDIDINLIEELKNLNFLKQLQAYQREELISIFEDSILQTNGQPEISKIRTRVQKLINQINNNYDISKHSQDHEAIKNDLFHIKHLVSETDLANLNKGIFKTYSERRWNKNSTEYKEYVGNLKEFLRIKNKLEETKNLAYVHNLMPKLVRKLIPNNPTIPIHPKNNYILNLNIAWLQKDDSFTPEAIKKNLHLYQLIDEISKLGKLGLSVDDAREGSFHGEKFDLKILRELNYAFKTQRLKADKIPEITEKLTKLRKSLEVTALVNDYEEIVDKLNENDSEQLGAKIIKFVNKSNPNSEESLESKAHNLGFNPNVHNTLIKIVKGQNDKFDKQGLIKYLDKNINQIGLGNGFAKVAGQDDSENHTDKKHYTPLSLAHAAKSNLQFFSKLASAA